MILQRIRKQFRDIDDIYADLYDSKIEFDNNVCNLNKEKLLANIDLLIILLKKYKYNIKNIYIRKDNSDDFKK